MIKFSEQLYESTQEYVEFSAEEMELYLKKVRLPNEIKIVVKVLLQNNITNPLDVQILIDGNSSQLLLLSKKYNLPKAEFEDLQKLLFKKPENVKLLPMLMTREDMDSLIRGDKTIEDITLDLETERGRERVAKEYTKLVMSIAHKYKSSGLDMNSIVSAGMLGLYSAMKDYNKPEFFADLEQSDTENAKKYKKLSFKQYAGWRIKQQILNDINDYARTVRIPQSQYIKNKETGNTKGNYNTVYFDHMFGDDEEAGSKIDRFLNLADTPDSNLDDREKGMKNLQILLNKKFSSRDCLVLYKSFGLFGYDRLKQKEIAKELNMTPANVNIILNKILKFMKGDIGARKYLQQMYDLQMESICIKYYNKPKEVIFDALISNDAHILLESIVRLETKETFNNIVGNILENYGDDERETILTCLENDLNTIDNIYEGNKQLIVEFLSSVYPTEKIKHLSDVDVIERMLNISETFKRHNF
jgi:RNA polymerase sigma factor (sigma-70 family)